MRFTLYTKKTVRECMSAINDRMQARATRTRPALDGWIEKGGKFSLAVTSKVAGRFSRRTRLRAVAERQSGVTVIRGYVPHGVPRRGVLVIMGAVIIMGFLIALSGNALLGLVAAVLGMALYIPLTGDYDNSEILMKEIRRALKAKDKPPK